MAINISLQYSQKSLTSSYPNEFGARRVAALDPVLRNINPVRNTVTIFFLKQSVILQIRLGLDFPSCLSFSGLLTKSLCPLHVRLVLSYLLRYKKFQAVAVCSPHNLVGGRRSL